MPFPERKVGAWGKASPKGPRPYPARRPTLPSPGGVGRDLKGGQGMEKPKFVVGQTVTRGGKTYIITYVLDDRTSTGVVRYLATLQGRSVIIIETGLRAVE